ncbi:TBC1 domain family member 1 [Plakobranchus ocellatus]|uniref:TBC1 domain family member 1 n=1 Tax=Plakobranchus ocellatus TaxID=259542 RepID=A0AAV4AKE3_9GAST|nr:TBC1 domain family member 1 [Plakobranchus ocellatus]
METAMYSSFQEFVLNAPAVFLSYVSSSYGQFLWSALLLEPQPVLTPNSPQQQQQQHLSNEGASDLSPASSGQEDPALLSASLPQRRPSASWRKAIFQRVVTAQQSEDIAENDGGEGGVPSGSKPTNVRDMWRKAFLETLLLIRMEKENHSVRARQEEGGVIPSRKLEYQELTPCLKEITSVWEDMLSNIQEVVAPEEDEEREEEEGREDTTEREQQREDEEKEEDGEELLEGETITPRVQMAPVSHETLLEYVKKGVPRSLRGQIWLFLMQQRQLSGVSGDDDDDAGVVDDDDSAKRTGGVERDVAAAGRARCGNVDYEVLLKQLTTHQHAILIDLGRTFPSHPYFSKSLGAGQLELFNLLKAYSLLDTEVGYCQGLSFIVGMLLMHMEEISAFHVLKYMMYDLRLRRQFKPNMTALQMKLYQLTRLLHDHCRDVYDHFESHDISPTLYAAPWFLTLFASQFPLGFVARVFDMIFVQGIDVLFKVALMLLVNHRALILQCNSFESVVDFLKTTLPEMVQVQMERVISQAFELDITRDLQAYEIEYHVIGEELAALESSQPQHHHHHHHHQHHNHLQANNRNNPLHPNHPHHPLHHGSARMHPPLSAMERPSRFLNRRRSSIDFELMYRMEHQNRALKLQNSELVEKLQHAQSQQRTSELAIHANKIEQDKLKSHIRTLEIERAALLTTVATMKRLLPHDALARLNLNLNLSHLPAGLVEGKISPSTGSFLQGLGINSPTGADFDAAVPDNQTEQTPACVAPQKSSPGADDTFSRSSPEAFDASDSSSIVAKGVHASPSPQVHQRKVKKEIADPGIKVERDETGDSESPSPLTVTTDKPSLSSSSNLGGALSDSASAGPL